MPPEKAACHGPSQLLCPEHPLLVWGTHHDEQEGNSMLASLALGLGQRWRPQGFQKLSRIFPFPSGDSVLPISFHILKQLGMGLAELERTENGREGSPGSGQAAESCANDISDYA